MKLFNQRNILFIKIAISFVLIVYFINIVDLKQVFTNLSHVNIFFIICALLLQLGIRFFKALKLRIVLNHFGIKISIFRIFAINMSATFYNIIFPGDILAGIVKIIKLSGENRLYNKVTSAIVFSLITEYALVLLFGFSALLLNNPFSSSILRTIFLYIFFLLFILYPLIYFPRFNKAISKILLGCFSWLPENFRKKTEDSIYNFASIYKLNMKNIFYIHLLSFASILFGVFTIYTLSIGLNIGLNIFTVFWLRAIVVFIQLMPISVLGVGLREGLFISILGLYGIDKTQSFSLSILVSSIIMLVVILGGLIELYNYFRSRRV